MFQITQNPFGTIPAVQLHNEAEQTEVEILCGWGSGLNRFLIHRDDETMHFVAGYENEQDLRENFADYSRGAKLFPFPNRLNEGKYVHEERSLELPINFRWQKHAIHGLLSTQSFEPGFSRCTEEAAEVVLRNYYDGSEAGYPFPFEMIIRWRLTNDQTLECRSTVRNAGQTTMPCGDGWHPYFTLNFIPINQCRVSFPIGNKLETDDLSLPTGIEFPDDSNVKSKSIGEDFIDHCWYFPELNQQEQHLVTTLDSTQSPWVVKVQQDENYPYLQLYTPGERDCIAIEPMSCSANALNHKRNLVILRPGEEKNWNWTVQVQRKP